MDNDFWVHFKEQVEALIFNFGPKLIYAAVALVVGIVLIKLIRGAIMGLMRRANAELSLQSFIQSISTAILWGFLFFVVGLILGIKASVFITAFGAAGIAIGLALQGSLSNFAGGLLILIFKPFKVGDEVVIDDVEGYVEDINILYTHVNNWRGEVFTIPNGSVSNNKVRNNSAEAYRRVQIELHFNHDEDIDELRELITSTMKKHPQTNAEKPYQLRVNSFQDYYIKTSARCWCRTEKYWDVYWDQEEAIKKALNKKGIKLAIPTQAIRHLEMPEKQEA